MVCKLNVITLLTKHYLLTDATIDLVIMHWERTMATRDVGQVLLLLKKETSWILLTACRAWLKCINVKDIEYSSHENKLLI